MKFYLTTSLLSLIAFTSSLQASEVRPLCTRGLCNNQEAPLSRRSAYEGHVMPEMMETRCVDQGHAIPGCRIERPVPVRQCRVVRQVVVPPPCYREVIVPSPCNQEVIYIEEPCFVRPCRRPYFCGPSLGLELSLRKRWRC